MTVKVTKPAVNLREKLAEVDKPSGIAGEAMLRAETPQEQFNLIGAGRKNLIINGGFQVSQRGDYTGSVALTNGAYTLDRWTCSNGVGATITHQTAMPVGEAGKSVKVLTSSGGTLQCAIEQRMEVANWMYGKTVVASAWVRSNSNKASINIYNNTDGFWTQQSHSGSGQWEKLSITGTLPTSMNDFRVRIGLSQSGNTTIVAGDYFEIAQVQLELGKVATPFEHRSYGEELALCQRYFWNARAVNNANGNFSGIAMAYSADSIYWPIAFPVQMRVVPAIISGGTWRTRRNDLVQFTAAFTYQSSGINGVLLTQAGSSNPAASVFWVEPHDENTAFLYFDAEL